MRVVSAEIAFAVISASTDYKIGSFALKGKYVGGGSSAAVGVAAGAEVLVGGGGKNISLQPIAVSGGTGLGAAGGATYLFLKRK